MADKLWELSNSKAHVLVMKGNLTWGGVNTQYNIHMMCYRIVPLKPVLLTNVTLVNSIKRNKVTKSIFFVQYLQSSQPLLFSYLQKDKISST